MLADRALFLHKLRHYQENRIGKTHFAERLQILEIFQLIVIVAFFQQKREIGL